VIGVAPVYLVPKPDGTFCFCIDFRKLNVVTKTDSFFLPRIEDLYRFESEKPNL